MLERIGEYEVTGRLGQGAMGVVLRVRHVHLGAERALKLLAATTPDRMVRFEREVRALAEVRHPNVVALHEAGQLGGRPWFVMDLVEGEPLEQVLRRGRLPLDAALRLASGLARGVAALHARGVVHRDLKPGNVMVRPDGSPVILDLGLALSPESDERLTRTGALVGTLGYMAPEQLLGQRASSACDVYALGAIPFEAASGEPLVAGTPTLQSMIGAVVEGRTPSLASVAPDLPEALDRLVSRLLAREPTARPDVASLVEALDDPALRSGRAVAAARRGRRLRRLALAVVGAAALCGVLLHVGKDGLAPSTAQTAALATDAQTSAAAATEVAPDPLEVERGLERALHLPLPADRAPELAAWLRANPTHARSSEALTAWREARRQAPLAVWELGVAGRVSARWIDERRAVAWAGTTGLWIGDPRTGALDLVAPEVDVQDAVRDPRGGVLLAAAEGRTLSRIAPGARELVADHPLPRRRSVDALAAGRAVIVVLQGDKVSVLDRGDGRVVREIGPIGDAPKHMALADGDRVLLVASGPAVFAESRNVLTKLRGYDLTTGELLFEESGGDRTSFVLGDPGGGFVAGTVAGVLRAHDLDGRKERQLSSRDIVHGFTGGFLGGVAHEATVRGAAFVDGGRRLISLAGQFTEPPHGDMRCWDTTTGEELTPPVRWSVGVVSLDVSSDERLVLVGREPGTVELWAAPHREAELDLEPVRSTADDDRAR